MSRQLLIGADLGGSKITSVADPSSAQDAATKIYADLKLAKASNLADLANVGTARTNLGLIIGSDVQAYDPDLTTIASLVATTDNFIVSVASAWASRTPAQVRTTLGLVIGTNVQAWDADLDSIAGLTATTNNFMVGSASAWASRTPTQAIAHLGLDADLATFVLPASTTISAFGATLVDDADATTARTTLGLGTAATHATGDYDAAGAAAAAQAASQPLDADLTTIAGLTATTDSFIQSKASAWAARTVAQVKTDLGLTGTNSGDQTITLTGDVTGAGTGSFAATIAAGAVSLAKMANLAANSFIGNNTGSAATPIALTVAQAKTLLALVKGDVGLGSVDNTTDAGKPVSTAQQTALDLKANIASPTFTGTTTAPAWSTSGLTGSVAATRWVGATTTGAPSTGAHSVGDWVVTQDGHVFICTGAGTPGTWADAAAGSFQPLDADLTTLAGLTATTDNFIVSVASAWASRTPAQAKTTLALVKGDVGLGNVDNTADSAKTFTESQITNLVTDLAAKQPLDSDLTTIAGLTATTDNFMVASASAWASRTPAQARTHLGLGSSIIAGNVFLIDGTANISGGSNGMQLLRLDDAIFHPSFGFERVHAGAAVNIGDQLGAFWFRGALDATPTMASGASVQGVAEQNFSSGNAGTRLDFLTTPIAGGSPNLRLTVDSAGSMHLVPTTTLNRITGSKWAVTTAGAMYGGTSVTYTSNQPTSGTWGVSAAGAMNAASLTLTTPLAVAQGGSGGTTTAALRTLVMSWDDNTEVASNVTTTGQALVNITGLTAALTTGTWEFEAILRVGTSADTTGCQYGLNITANLNAVDALITANTSATAVTSLRIGNNATASGTYLTTSGVNGLAVIKGMIVMTGAGTFTIQHLKVTSGTSTVKAGSVLKIRQVA